MTDPDGVRQCVGGRAVAGCHRLGLFSCPARACGGVERHIQQYDACQPYSYRRHQTAVTTKLNATDVTEKMVARNARSLRHSSSSAAVAAAAAAATAGPAADVTTSAPTLSGCPATVATVPLLSGRCPAAVAGSSAARGASTSSIAGQCGGCDSGSRSMETIGPPCPRCPVDQPSPTDGSTLSNPPTSHLFGCAPARCPLYPAVRSSNGCPFAAWRLTQPPAYCSAHKQRDDRPCLICRDVIFI